MELKLTRKEFTERSTIGELGVNGTFECFTLEDPVRPEGVKIPGQTAIPEGTYPIIINFSYRFKRLLPLLKNVPGFDGVRIHVGNVPEDTEGCILVGESKGENIIYQSGRAFGRLWIKLYEAFGIGPISITVTKEVMT